MPFNFHRGLSRIIDTFYWLIIATSVIGLLLALFKFFMGDFGAKEVGYSLVAITAIVGSMAIIRWILYYIINGFFDDK